jgi:hypothetical protein
MGVWWLGVLITIVITGNSVANDCTFEDDVALEYRILGGTPGDHRIHHVLTITIHGDCYYTTLNTECCTFTMKDEELKAVLHIAEDIVKNRKEPHKGFLPDSTIVTMKLSLEESDHEVSFYADESLEDMYPEQRRSEEFTLLETVLSELIGNNCCEDTDLCDESKPLSNSKSE